MDDVNMYAQNASGAAPQPHAELRSSKQDSTGSIHSWLRLFCSFELKPKKAFVELSHRHHPAPFSRTTSQNSSNNPIKLPARIAGSILDSCCAGRWDTETDGDGPCMQAYLCWCSSVVWIRRRQARGDPVRVELGQSNAIKRYFLLDREDQERVDYAASSQDGVKNIFVQQLARIYEPVQLPKIFNSHLNTCMKH